MNYFLFLGAVVRNVVIGLYGPSLDRGMKPSRWDRWRPSLALCGQEDLIVDRFELLYQSRFEPMVDILVEDIAQVSPETKVVKHEVVFENPWAFDQVYAALFDFARAYDFKPDEERYLIHITTGTHVAQICLFLLTESGYFPGSLLQLSPPKKWDNQSMGSHGIIDLDLSKYDQLASRFDQELKESVHFLKSGIETANPTFNKLIEEIETVALRSRDPMLLMGPTGAGKSHLAKRIFQLKKRRGTVVGEFAEVNCAVLRGDGAMSALFGHVRGAFTGALSDRSGLLRKADRGVLFLDEIGELGLDEQAMLLRALEDKVFMPLGSDREISSDFELIAGTNRDLREEVRKGRFREDLLARIDLWSFRLPSLRERLEDIEANVVYELEQFARKRGFQTGFNREALSRFLAFATGPEALWKANFRDLNASITRMATLAGKSRINQELVDKEIGNLRNRWSGEGEGEGARDEILGRFFSEEALAEIDLFDRPQLSEVLRVCGRSKNLAEAGRVLFQASRQRRKTVNDSDRLRKYLSKFDLDPAAVIGHGGG